MTAEHGDKDIADWTRKGMRDAFAQDKLIVKMVKDLKYLLDIDDEMNPAVMNLWDDRQGLQKFGVQYHEFNDGDE